MTRSVWATARRAHRSGSRPSDHAWTPGRAGSASSGRRRVLRCGGDELASRPPRCSDRIGRRQAEDDMSEGGVDRLVDQRHAISSSDSTPVDPNSCGACARHRSPEAISALIRSRSIRRDRTRRSIPVAATRRALGGRQIEKVAERADCRSPEFPMRNGCHQNGFRASPRPEPFPGPHRCEPPDVVVGTVRVSHTLTWRRIRLGSVRLPQARRPRGPRAHPLPHSRRSPEG